MFRLQKEQKWRADARELRDRVRELEAELEAERKAQRDEAASAEARDEWERLEGKARARPGASHLAPPRAPCPARAPAVSRALPTSRILSG